MIAFVRKIHFFLIIYSSAFDIEEAFAQSVRFNEIAIIGTHNSYQMTETGANRMVMKLLK